MPRSAKPTASTTIHRPALRHPKDQVLCNMSVRFIVELLRRHGGSCNVSKRTCGQHFGPPHRCLSLSGRGRRSQYASRRQSRASAGEDEKNQVPWGSPSGIAARTTGFFRRPFFARWSLYRSPWRHPASCKRTCSQESSCRFRRRTYPFQCGYRPS